MSIRATKTAALALLALATVSCATTQPPVQLNSALCQNTIQVDGAGDTSADLMPVPMPSMVLVVAAGD